MPGPLSLQPTQPVLQTPEQKEKAIRDAARQLEGVFVGMMFEEMAKGVGKEGMFANSPAGNMYQQWFRREIADQFSRSRGLGLGDAVARQMGAAGVQKQRTHKAVPVFRKMPPPVQGVVTSGFGRRVHPVTGKEHHHNGVDIAVAVGTAVKTPYEGRVSRVGKSKLLGNYVELRHRAGYSTLYAHLSKSEVDVGDVIPAGARVGQSGRSGRVTGPHLHFAMYRRGAAVDPARWIQLPGKR